jgi:prephenate dehydrogenase
MNEPTQQQLQRIQDLADGKLTVDDLTLDELQIVADMMIDIVINRASNLGNLQTENAIIIKESDHMGKIFFKDLYGSLKLNVCEYTFEGHDEVVAYSLSVPFASTLVFASIMKHQDAPGTTFKKHMAIARGLLSEDDYLLTEILFNPKTPAQIDNIVATLTHLSKIIDKKDSGKMKRFLDGVRKNLE